MFKPRHVALAALIALATIAAVGTASAQSWPTRPVTLVVPFAAGSSSDTAGRVLAVGLSEALGQQVIIENVGGGGGMTGTARVAKAPPTDTRSCSEPLTTWPSFRRCTNSRPTTARPISPRQASSSTSRSS